LGMVCYAFAQYVFHDCILNTLHPYQ
jgi:hypothetical protein